MQIRPNIQMDLFNLLKYSESTFFYLDAGKVKTRLISHNTMDLTIQNTIKRTTKPAKIVRNGGPWELPLASFLVSSGFSGMNPSEGLFDAHIGSSLWLMGNLEAFLNLKLRGVKWRLDERLMTLTVRESGLQLWWWNPRMDWLGRAAQYSEVILALPPSPKNLWWITTDNLVIGEGREREKKKVSGWVNG